MLCKSECTKSISDFSKHFLFSFQYTKLTRNEKIDRLFIVLNLLVKLMEIDLSIWMQRYPFQTRLFMSNPNTCPLIAHLLWKGKDCGEINVMIRDVLKLFTMSVWIEFPNDKTDILAVRLKQNYKLWSVHGSTIKSR